MNICQTCGGQRWICIGDGMIPAKCPHCERTEPDQEAYGDDER